jgi:ribosomal protein S12 methylthiotransferase accessory factor YcaO
LIAGARDDADRAMYARLRDPQPIAAAARALAASVGPRAFTAAPDAFSDNLDDELAAVIGALRAAGFGQILTVDLGRPELAVPVVRVVVPGLESMWDAAGYAPGPRARAAARAS